MLDFCPYEPDMISTGFKKLFSVEKLPAPNSKEMIELELKELAYELVFFVGTKPKDVQKIVGDSELIKPQKDEKLYKAYGDTSIHYILEKGNMLKYLELIESKKKAKSETGDGYNDTLVGGSDTFLEYRRGDDGSYVFSQIGGAPVMKAYPCCGECHKRLPIGWLLAEDFCGVSLVSDQGGGKTTYIASLMADEWEALRFGDDDWRISPAHTREVNVESADLYYDKLYEAAKKLVNEGECPDRTQTEGLVEPIFLNIEYRGHIMIVGIYDNSGEVLRKMIDLDSRLVLVSNLDAHIYLVEPKQMRKLPNHVEEENGEDVVKTYSVDTIDVQGKEQEKHAGESVIARTLLQMYEMETVNNDGRRRGNGNPLEILNLFEGLLQRAGKTLSGKHICVTAIKSDLLQNIFEIQKDEKYKFLFSRGENMDVLHIGGVREQLVRDLLSQYAFTGREMRILEGGGKSVSYHLVSSLGCDTYETKERRTVKVYENDEWVTKDMDVIVTHLKDEYDPIRVAEPLMTCIQKKVIENGWMD